LSWFKIMIMTLTLTDIVTDDVTVISLSFFCNLIIDYLMQ